MSVYEKHIMSEPRLPFIFHSYIHEKRLLSTRGGNWHENVELLYFTSGSATVTSNALHIEVKPGDLAVINANCIHEIFAHEKTHFYCLIIDRSFCLANHFDTNLITFLPKIRDGEICALIEEIAAEYAHADTPYRIQSICAGVLRVMSLLCRKYSEQSDKPTGDTRLLSSIKLALGYISSECTHPLTLDMIADKAGLSKFYLAREFRRITGKTIITYINIARCERAKLMLSENELSIESIARSCGFPNASYFTKTFKNLVGMLPSEYRSTVKITNRT